MNLVDFLFERGFRLDNNIFVAMSGGIGFAYLTGWAKLGDSSS